VNKRSVSIALLSLVVLCAAHSQALRMSIMDFEVVSENPQYKSLGKGFTELTSVQVSKLPGVTLVDRARRNELLEEQAFAISDSADSQKSIAIGKLLAVDYLIAGSVLDMLGDLVVSYEVIRTDTGEIVGKDQASGPATDYKRMVKEIGTSIGKLTGKTIAAAKAAEAPPVKAAPVKVVPVEKQAVVLQSFSEAVEALDNKDVKTAEAKLNEAKTIDPGNEAVGIFLSKLAKGTSKFAVNPDYKYSLNNPANLALIGEDSAYFVVSYGSPGFLEGKSLWEAWVPLAGTYGGKKYYLGEQEGGEALGYSLPLGKRAGLGVQVFQTNRTQTVRNIANPPDQSAEHYTSMPVGGSLSFGWSPAPWLSLGIGANAGYSLDNNPAPPDYGISFYGGELGLLFKNPGGDLMLSALVAASTLAARQFDMGALPQPTVGALLDAPIHLDLTGTMGFNQSRDFAVLKYLCDFYGLNMSYPPFLQLIPAYEHWFGTKLSLRLGGILTMAPTNANSLGFGGTLGATFVLGSWEFDTGATYRNRPSYTILEEMVSELVFSIGIRRNGLFARR
jgi:TolB-like protein